MLILLAIPSVFATELVRVDVPDHPQAIATSAIGSTLLGPRKMGRRIGPSRCPRRPARLTMAGRPWRPSTPWALDPGMPRVSTDRV